LERPLPRFVEVRRLARGSAAFYFRIPTYYRKLGCEMANEPLGASYEAACGDDGKGGRAATLVVSDADYAGVRRAVTDLRADVERVTGIAPRVSASDAVCATLDAQLALTELDA